MENQIVKQAETYVIDLLKNGLTDDHRYHDLHHTLSVRDASQAIGKRYQMSDEELELLELAALFHDTGFVRSYDDHENQSKAIAQAFLEKLHYPAERIKRVQKLIDVTKVGTEPQTLTEKVLKDADFNTYESSYSEKSIALRHEWRLFRNNEMNDEQWLENNFTFWKTHQFYTGEGKAMFGEAKRRMLKQLKKQMEKATPKKSKKKIKDQPLEFTLNSSKSAQMMFKTTLRNQIDLTNIADNKANIMLTINSALITFGIPLLATRLDTQPELLYPAATLLLTCILSIVFATLATRPAKMAGKTDLEKIGSGNTNLFFFGNFFKMPRNEYRDGLKQVIQSNELLDQTIVNDLYFLGLSLGRKYSRLYTTYSIFMVGMVLTVLTYAIAAFVAKGGG